MEKFHTIIIGAGPAGLACATILAANGKKVLVLERNKSVGPKVCAGGVPFHAMKRLKLPDSIVQKQFPIQHIITPGQNARVHSPLPIITTVDRQQLGQHMLAKAQAVGAQVKTNTMVRTITASQVHTGLNKYSFQYLVGADGSNSMVRRFLKVPAVSQGTGIHYRVPGHFTRMEWHFQPNQFNSGYAWIFPHKQYASIGAYASRDDVAPSLLQKKLQTWSKDQGISLKGCKPAAFLINFDFRGWRFNNIFLAGDAAGLASALTGEGILPAVISGEAVAKTILQPNIQIDEFDNLLLKHQRHKKVQELFATQKVFCHIALEVLTLALRCQLIHFRNLEMG